MNAHQPILKAGKTSWIQRLSCPSRSWETNLNTGVVQSASMYATITGISMAPNYILMLAAPLLAATMFDARGDYTLPFLILGGLGAMSGVFFLFARKPQSVDPVRRFGVARSQA